MTHKKKISRREGYVAIDCLRHDHTGQLFKTLAEAEAFYARHLQTGESYRLIYPNKKFVWVKP